MDTFSYRKKKKPSRRVYFICIGLFIILGGFCIGTAYLILYSDFLKIKSFELQNVRFVTEENLLSLLRKEMVKGNFLRSLVGSENILFWELGNAPEVLEGLPLVKTIGIKSEFFKKKIVVDIEERILFGILCREDRCYGFDEEGILFVEVPRVEGALIIKITDENNTPIFFGRPFFSNADKMQNVFKIIEAFEKNNFTITAIKIHSDELQEWSVEISSGLLFYFSLQFVPEDLESIIQNLDERFGLENQTYFDFRVQNRIYYK